MKKQDNGNGGFTITVPRYMKGLFPDSKEIKISNIRDRLPYVLNNKHDNGPDFSWRQITTDQYRCYNKKWLSEHDCAAILLGIPFPNAAYLIIGKEIRNIHDKFEHGDLANLDLNYDLNYMMGLYQLNSIFTEIKNMFILSKQELSPREKPQITSPIENEFEKDEFPALFTTPLSGFFETNLLYETKIFFEVAKDNGFSIPKELLGADNGCAERVDTASTQKNGDKNITLQNVEIDYSKKSEREQAALAHKWCNEGMTKEEVAQRLFKEEWEAKAIKPDSFKTRIKRLKRNYPDS